MELRSQELALDLNVMAMNQDFQFISRRSPVISLNAAVATSQPQATEIGYKILKSGGNAADAAVGIAAALNLVEPMSTGLGGDCFVLYYDAKKLQVQGINGSGTCPSKLTLDFAKQISNGTCIPLNSAHAVTVPGAAAAWVDTVENFGSGKLSLMEIFEPTIALASEGFVVHPVCSCLWKGGTEILTQWEKSSSKDLLLEGRAPNPGEIMTNAVFANTLKELGSFGKKGFYRGRIANAIVDVVQQNNGLLSLEDLHDYDSIFESPISTVYEGICIWEMPPSGQGIAALIALNILKNFDIKAMGHNSADYLHTMIEAVQLAFADSLTYVADGSKVTVPVQELLSAGYCQGRSQLINMNKTLLDYPCGEPYEGSDTVYFTVVDSQGNACSFINSVYTPFGCGLVPEGCGFSLQNRGNQFSLNADHLNVLEPGKRPYHTIIPGMATHEDTKELYCSFGVMGKYMQPQGHVQVLSNMINFGMDPQVALDQPRFYIAADRDRTVYLEEGIQDSVVEELRARGHFCHDHVKGEDRFLMGRGQIIQKRASTNGRYVLWSGSDPRGDGMALGY